MHESTKRLYESLKFSGHIKGRYPQKEVARLLNVSPQMISNWESRGISKEGMLSCQKDLAISATWLEFGEGPEIHFDTLLRGTVNLHSSHKLSDEELDLLTAFSKVIDTDMRKQIIGYVEWIAKFKAKP